MRSAGHHSPLRRWIPVFLLFCYAVQCLWFIGSQSFTYDEPTHLAAATEVWQQGKFQRANDHPPLVRLWYTLPLLARPAEFLFNNESGPVAVRINPAPETIAWLTRPLNMLLGIALGFMVWLTTRRFFSEGAANLALAFFCFSPECIAHFSLATTDGAGTLFLFLGAWQLIRWRQRPDWLRTVQLGLVMGGMVLSKFYNGPAVLVIVVIVLLSARHWNPARWRWKMALAASAVAFVTVWAGYFFHVSRLDIDNGHMVASFPNREPIVKDLRWKGSLHLLIPAGEMVDGVRAMAIQNHRGRPTWFMGKLYPKGGTRAYYPTAILLKWPTVVLLCAFASLVLGVFRKLELNWEFAVLMLFPVIHFGLALSSPYNIGVRHVLPVYPFVVVLAGAIWEALRPHRYALALALLAVLLNAADTLRYAPNYLAHFNVFVGRDEGWHLLSDSNLDWGQGLLALRDYQRRHPDETLHLAYFGGVDPAVYGIRYLPLQSGTPVKGTVVISTSRMIGHTLDDPLGVRWRREHPAGAAPSGAQVSDANGYEWLQQHRPETVLDHCLFVYKVR